MDNIKDDKYYIKRIIEYIDFAYKNLFDVKLEEFEENDVLLNAIMFSFIQISENASKLSDVCKSNDKIPWNKIRGIRNIIVHDYDVVNYDVIYLTVKNDLPKFKEQIQTFLMR